MDPNEGSGRGQEVQGIASAAAGYPGQVHAASANSAAAPVLRKRVAKTWGAPETVAASVPQGVIAAFGWRRVR